MSAPATYYDWGRTLSYNADITMVITSRGRGKTFGIRRAALDEALKRGYRFAEIVRYKSEISEVMAGYFDKIAADGRYDDWELKTEKRRGYARKKDSKEPWACICYFVTLSEAQNAKKRTYANIRKIIFDEALIEPGTYLRYLPREWQTLTNLVDTLTREVAGEARVRPHLYMLSNACDLVNPFFSAWGVDSIPAYGYTWYANRAVLLHYEDPTSSDFSARKATETLAGRMAATSDEAVTAIDNRFQIATADDIAQKPSSAKFWTGLIYKSKKFGIWVDFSGGYYYINRRIPEGSPHVYSLTRADNSANRLIARKATPAMRAIIEAYYDRIVRFDSISTREQLLDALGAFGVR